MKTLKSKAAAILIATLLTFSMTASMMLIPTASAHSPPWKIPTWAYLNIAPNPIGIGQTAYVTMWVDKVMPTVSGSGAGSGAGLVVADFGDVFHNFTLTITNPSGTVITEGPFTSGYSAGYAYTFTPTALGNYTFVFHFGGSTVLGSNPPPAGFTAAVKAFIGDYMEPSVSAPATLTVTQTQLPSYPYNPLPTSYWSRPIEASGNLGWSSISGNWLGLASVEATTGAYSNLENFNPYTTAPTTSHILWTKPVAFGGLIGGEFGALGESGGSYKTNNHNEPQFAPIIIQGILYWTNYPGAASDPMGWNAVNLQTGQSEWTQSPPTTSSTYTGTINREILRNGQTLIFTSTSQYGGQAYLWGTSGTTYSMYDAMTGNWILNVTGATLGTLAEDSNGGISDYYVNSTISTAPTLNLWNSTLCLWKYQGYGTLWSPTLGANIPFADGIQWTIPLPTTYQGSSIPTLSISKVDTGVTDTISEPVVLMSGVSPIGYSNWNEGWEIEAGYNANTGQQIWITNRTLTPWAHTAIMCAQNGMYAELCYETGAWSMYSMTTGQLLWGPVVSPAWSTWDSESAYNGVIAYGELITAGYGGDVSAFNVTNGNVLWTWTTPPSGLASVYGDYNLMVDYTLDTTVAGGEVFIGGGHLYNPPMYQGSQLYVVNATTGKTAWTDLGFDSEAAAAISDGIAIDYNSYDCQIYAYGQGPSKTTVTAPGIGITTATPVTITGTVTDISAGSQENAVAMNFPNGLPCVSDASMTQFMEAVYQQQPMPTNVTGVPVTLSVTDSNGNHYNIGTVTTNSNGFYSLTWTPIIPGNYTVTATFAGTQSYYGSSANTAFYASTSAPTAAPTTPPVTGLASTGTVELGIAAVIIVIIIIGAVLAVLTLRKRP